MSDRQEILRQLRTVNGDPRDPSGIARRMALFHWTGCPALLSTSTGIKKERKAHGAASSRKPGTCISMLL